jgi:hypothetical protein
MTTPMISEQWPRFVLPIIRKEWFEKLQAVSSPIGGLYGVETSTSSVEYSQGIGDFSVVPEYNSDTAEGNAASIMYDTFSSLYEKTFTHKEYAKGVAIERKLWDDDRLGNIRRRAQGLGNAFGTTIATHQASVLVNAFSSSFVGGDGKALCATDHPRSEKDATAWSNKGTSALAYASIVATLQAGKRMTDDRGNPMPVMYDTLVVPVELEATAYEQTKGLLKPSTADNDASFLGSKGLQVVVDPYLTNAKDWFMVDSARARMHLLWFWRVRPELALDPTSDFNLVAKYRGYMRYSFGWDDARFVYGHDVA